MKLLTAILFFLTATLCCAQTGVPKTGWYFLAEKASEGILVGDIDSKNVFAIETNPTLAKTDFKNVRIVTRDFEPNDVKAIEIHLTKDGRKKWNEAKKRIAATHESILFVYNGKVYLEKFVYGGSKTLTAFLDLFVGEKYIDEIFDELQHSP